jgi:hypothetical protein
MHGQKASCELVRFVLLALGEQRLDAQGRCLLHEQPVLKLTLIDVERAQRRYGIARREGRPRAIDQRHLLAQGL